MNLFGTIIVLADKQDGSGKVVLEYIENSKNVVAEKEHLILEFNSWEEAVNHTAVWNRLSHCQWWDPYRGLVWVEQT